MTQQVIRICPQKGAQERFLASKADIVFYGGAAGGGKSYGILLDPLRHINVKGFNAVVFRRNSTHIKKAGGLLDTSRNIYPLVGGNYRLIDMEWIFNASGINKDNNDCSRICFGHLEHEKTVYEWQGAQITALYWDELTHFSRFQFFYMLSRNRSTCGVKPYVRATTNPDSESWVRKFIDWWINPETGLAIPERSGVIRWFIIRDDKEIWGDSPEEIKKLYPTSLPKSFTFINASIYDNQILLKTNPEYLANLEALPRVEREKLLGGNWNVKAEAGAYFQKRYFEIVHKAPAQTKKVRYWDRAATKKTSENDPDWTVGIKAEKDADGVIYITDVVRFQDTALAVQKAIRNTAALDTVATKIGIEQDPGQAGKSEAEYLVRQLSGYVAKAYTVSKDKITRCLPASAQAEAGNIKLVEGKWNEDFLKELENFPSTAHDDQVDALSGAFLMLTETRYDISAMGNL